jgi:hypothetical protein
MLGGASLDVVDDLDRIVLAAANPFGANGQAPDWVVLVKAAGRSDRRLRAAVEAMADSDRPLAPSPVNPPEDRPSPRRSPARDAGADASERENIWTEREGARITNLRRYGAVRSYVLLADGTAAIALPSQLDGLLAALARRPPSVADDPSARAAVVIESDGIRNMIAEVPTMHGPFPLPRRVALTLSPDGGNEGGAELSARFEYDSPAQARAARTEWAYVQTRWSPMIDTAPGIGVLRLGSGLFGRRAWPDHVKDVIASIEFRAQASAVVGRVHMTEEQVRALLDGAQMVASFAQ